MLFIIAIILVVHNKGGDIEGETENLNLLLGKVLYKYYMKNIEIISKTRCIKCNSSNCEIRKRKTKPNGWYYFTQWDYCLDCGHLQHYEQYKKRTEEWKIEEEQLGVPLFT